MSDAPERIMTANCFGERTEYIRADLAVLKPRGNDELHREIDVKNICIAELEATVRGFLVCPEVADCREEDKDEDTRALESRARKLLEGQ